MKKFISNIFYYIGLIIISILVICGNNENGLILSLLSFAFIYFFVKQIKIRNFSLFLIIISLIIKIIVVIVIKTPIVTDCWIMKNATDKVLEGDLSFLNDIYFKTWGYQLFHVFYQAFVLKFFNNILVLKILNCVYSTIITLMIYLITKKLTNEDSARITSLLYLISIYPLYLNTTLGNHQLSLMLIMISIYILLYKNNNIKNLIIIGLLIGISNLERSEGIIYILTILVYFIVSNKKIKEIIKNSFIILFTFLLITKGSSYILIKSEFNEIGFSNNNPSWKFLLGFSYEHNGKYNYDDEAIVNDTDLVKKETINRIKQIKKWPNLFYNKTKILWLYDDFNDKAISPNISKDLSNIIVNYTKTMNIIIIIIGLFGLIKNRTTDKKLQFFLINICIYFGVYLLIEVQTRYYFNPQVSIIIISSIGIKKLLNFIDKQKITKSLQ